MALGSLFGRRCKLTITPPGSTTSVEINAQSEDGTPGLRVQFKIHKTEQKAPNTSEIIVSNLSPTRRGSLSVKGVEVILDAGYEATGVTRLFRGDARTIDHIRSGADWETTMRLGDGETAYRFARFAESFGPGSSASDILITLAQNSGLAMGNVEAEAQNITKVFDHGYSVVGSVSKSLDTLVKSVGYTWSTQDGAIQLLAPGANLSDSIPDISPDTGLIGSPEMGTPEKKGKPALCKFKSLLIPTTPGRLVKLTSERYPGVQVRVKKCSFEGDTMGGPWYTSFEGVIVP